jgi:hypothetical protein
MTLTIVYNFRIKKVKISIHNIVTEEKKNCLTLRAEYNIVAVVYLEYNPWFEPYFLCYQSAV